MSRHSAPLPVCLTFHVHQPYRLAKYDFFQIGRRSYYEDDLLNRRVFSQVAESCYLPAITLCKRLIHETGGHFRFGLSLSGLVLEQMEDYRPEVLEAFQELVATGSVDLIAQPYYHSLAALYSASDFERQVKLHVRKLREVFNQTARVFLNSEMVYNNRIAAMVEQLGFAGVLAEGVSWMQPGSCFNRLVRAPGVSSMKTLLRNSRLSDEIGFQLSGKSDHDAGVAIFRTLRDLGTAHGQLVNLVTPLEAAAGGAAGRTPGAFVFWKDFVPCVLEQGGEFLTPSEAVSRFEAHAEFDCPSPISSADIERDPSAWLGNVLQQEAALKVHGLTEAVLSTGHTRLIHAWSKLQCSDHLYYMSTKRGADGMMHRHFSPYDSPYDAYIYFMNALADLQIRVESALSANRSVA